MARCAGPRSNRCATAGDSPRTNCCDDGQVLPSSCATAHRPATNCQGQTYQAEVEYGACILLDRVRVRIRLGHVLVLEVLLLAIGWLPARPVHAAGQIPPAACPGYVSHLRRARSFLADGSRAAAVGELEQAKEALESCQHDDTGGGAAGVVA